MDITRPPGHGYLSEIKRRTFFCGFPYEKGRTYKFLLLCMFKLCKVEPSLKSINMIYGLAMLV